MKKREKVKWTGRRIDGSGRQMDRQMDRRKDQEVMEERGVCDKVDTPCA